MNWKIFVDWRKLLLTIILFTFSTGSAFLPCYSGQSASNLLSYLCFFLVFSWLFFPLIFLVSSSSPIFFVLALIEIYVISWIIVWIYDKLKKKK